MGHVLWKKAILLLKMANVRFHVNTAFLSEMTVPIKKVRTFFLKGGMREKSHLSIKALLHIQLTANQTARLPFYGVKWPFSRGHGPIVRVLTCLWSI